MTEKQICLVIGGSGFLGQYVVENLVDKGYLVRSFDIVFPENRIKGVHYYRGDLRLKDTLLPAMKDVHTVYHTASPSPLSNDSILFDDVNVVGTWNVINCCKESHVKNFVLTGTASVVFDGTDLKNGNENLPYVRLGLADSYVGSKIVQEEIVLESNGDSLRTIVLRPHGIFGPRDPQMIPTIVRNAKSGKTKFRIGNGENVVDYTYVGNVADALLLAGSKMDKDATICGQAYNITNDEPIKFWTFMDNILIGLGYEKTRYSLPYYPIYFLSYILLLISILLRPFYTYNPTLRPFLVAIVGRHHYYNCSKAKTRLGYKPKINLTLGLTKTLETFQHLKRN